MTALYIHLPFCKKKCNYCDFVSYAGKEDLIDDYVNSLCKEISSQLETGNWKLETIYFGGGTPTLLEPKHFNKIISTLIRNSALGIRHLEISIESNPATANKTKLKELRKLGINRLSIGAQSFNDEHLKTLGRIHDSKDVLKFYNDARSAGFDNINLDLIFALPNQTLDEWKQDLNKAIHLAPNHLSTYNLQIEQGTPFWELGIGNREPRVTSSQSPVPSLQLPDEETDLAMYEHTIETLTSTGYKHYEISNFAQPGYECKHNITYWKNENYIGIGAGAHSHVNGRRWANPDSVEEYLHHWKPETERLGFQQYEETAKFIRRFPSAPDQRETIFMGLRLLDGIPTDKFQGFEKEVAELIESGLLTKESPNIKLTRKGLYLANEVFEKFV